MHDIINGRNRESWYKECIKTISENSNKHVNKNPAQDWKKNSTQTFSSAVFSKTCPEHQTFVGIYLKILLSNSIP